MKDKKWFKITIGCIVFYFSLIAFLIITIDPYFHYRKPLFFLAYNINGENQRYVNDGILKHFDYDAIITGTSMTENFKSSQFDRLFKVNSVKVPCGGASYKEINENVKKALKYNSNVKYILRGLDYNRLLDSYDEMSYKSYPLYLYDEEIFNDVNYIFNMKVLFEIIKIFRNTILNKKTPDFDEYCRWNEKYISGKKEVLREYKRPDKKNIKIYLTENDKQKIDKNLKKNVIKLPKKYSNVKFIYFFTPYSIVYWDELNQKDEIEKQIMAEKYIIEKMLEVPNIELYSFFDKYDLITDLNNYRDAGHYMGHINDQILIWIKEGKYRLTKDNYKEYIKKNLEFYKNYDYDKIFEN